MRIIKILTLIFSLVSCNKSHSKKSSMTLIKSTRGELMVTIPEPFVRMSLENETSPTLSYGAYFFHKKQKLNRLFLDFLPLEKWDPLLGDHEKLLRIHYPQTISSLKTKKIIDKNNLSVTEVVYNIKKKYSGAFLEKTHDYLVLDKTKKIYFIIRFKVQKDGNQKLANERYESIRSIAVLILKEFNAKLSDEYLVSTQYSLKNKKVWVSKVSKSAGNGNLYYSIPVDYLILGSDSDNQNPDIADGLNIYTHKQCPAFPPCTSITISPRLILKSKKQVIDQLKRYKSNFKVVSRNISDKYELLINASEETEQDNNELEPVALINKNTKKYIVILPSSIKEMNKVNKPLLSAKKVSERDVPFMSIIESIRFD